MAKRIDHAQERDRLRLVYDNNLNIIELREYHMHTKVGQKKVRLTKLVYDNDCKLTKIIPNYETDKATQDDIDF